MKQLTPFIKFLRGCFIPSCELEKAIFKIKERSLGGNAFLTSDLCGQFTLKERWPPEAKLITAREGECQALLHPPSHPQVSGGAGRRARR